MHAEKMSENGLKLPPCFISPIQSIALKNSCAMLKGYVASVLAVLLLRDGLEIVVNLGNKEIFTAVT